MVGIRRRESPDSNQVMCDLRNPTTRVSGFQQSDIRLTESYDSRLRISTK